MRELFIINLPKTTPKVSEEIKLFCYVISTFSQLYFKLSLNSASLARFVPQLFYLFPSQVEKR